MVGLVDDEEERIILQTESLIDKPQKKPSFSEALSGVSQEIQSSKQSQLQSSMHYASQKDPDAHSKTVKTAKAAQMLPEAVELNPQDAESTAKFNDFSAALADVGENYKQTGQILSDPDTAAVIQDDVSTFQTLEDIWLATVTGNFKEAATKGAAALFLEGKEIAGFTEDKLLRSTAAGAIKTFASVPSTLGYLWDQGSFRSAQLLDLVLPESADRFLYTQEDNPQFIKDFNDAFSFASPGRVGKESGAAIASFADVVDVPKERKDWMTDITGAMGQISAMVMTAGIGGAGASTGLMFSQGADMQRQAMEQQGLQPTIGNMLLGGGITAVTERWGIDKLFNRLPTQVRSKFWGLVGDVAKAGSIEMFEEFVEGIAHNTLEFLSFNEDVDFTEGLIEEMRAAGGAAATFRLILQTFVPGRNRLNLMDYTGEQTKLDNMIKAAEESISKERDPSIIKRHVENLIDSNGENENIYIPASEVAEAFAELSLDQSIPEVKAVLEQMPEALRLGGDLVIPTQDFLAYFTDSEITGKIRKHLRLSPGGFTQTEAEAAQEVGGEELKAVMENAIEQENLKTEADQVTDNIAEQLIETGRMSTANARLNAKMLSSYVATQAQRSGKTVTETFEQLGLKIKGDKVTVPDSTTSGLNFAQNFGDIVFKDQKILSTTGKKVNIEQTGQKVWDRNVKRRKQTEKVKECLKT